MRGIGDKKRKKTHRKSRGEEAEKSAGEEEGVRIELRDNFRSVPGVLHFCNLVFESLMDRQFGGVDYTGEIALRPGQGGPMEKEEEQSEMLLLVEDEEKAQLAVEVNTVEAETALIARRIRELLEEGYTYDEMVILLRSGAGRAEFMAEVAEPRRDPGCLRESYRIFSDQRGAARSQLSGHCG